MGPRGDSGAVGLPGQKGDIGPRGDKGEPAIATGTPIKGSKVNYKLIFKLKISSFNFSSLIERASKVRWVIKVNKVQSEISVRWAQKEMRAYQAIQ
jgi:hypothetical protein